MQKPTTPLVRRMKKQARFFSVSACLCLVATFAQAACPSWATKGRFTFSGSEVTDLRTGFVWAQCSVGMNLGVDILGAPYCSGTASLLTHEAAMRHASTMEGWRLPTVKELLSLTDIGCSRPSIDSYAFPQTNYSTGYWTSTPKVDQPSEAWAVIFRSGAPFTYTRNTLSAVRLIRER